MCSVKMLQFQRFPWHKPANESGSHNYYVIDCAHALMETDSDLSHIL